METVRFSETLASTSQSTRRPNPEEHHHCRYRCENLLSHILLLLFPTINLTHTHFQILRPPHKHRVDLLKILLRGTSLLRVYRRVNSIDGHIDQSPYVGPNREPEEMETTSKKKLMYGIWYIIVNWMSKKPNCLFFTQSMACKQFQNKATAQVGAIVRVLVFKCQNAGWLVCIRKVLRTANSIKVFRVFPRSQSKYWVGTQIPRCTICLSPYLLFNLHFQKDERALPAFAVTIVEWTAEEHLIVSGLRVVEV
jgi:hypothetical protein